MSWFALLALLFATPNTQQLATNIATLISQDDCGRDDEEEDCKDEGRCPGPCETCLCCVHANAVANTLITVPVRRVVRELMSMQAGDGHADGHGSTPFRPPTA